MYRSSLEMIELRLSGSKGESSSSRPCQRVVSLPHTLSQSLYYILVVVVVVLSV